MLRISADPSATSRWCKGQRATGAGPVGFARLNAASGTLRVDARLRPARLLCSAPLHTPKAEGRYLDKDFWEIPRQAGSILDVPTTLESRERVARLRAQIAALETETELTKAAEHPAA